jgi:hypothetical protein
MMGGLVYLVHHQNIAIPLAVGLVSYPASCVAVGVVRVEELKQIWMLVLRRANDRPTTAHDG